MDERLSNLIDSINSMPEGIKIKIKVIANSKKDDFEFQDDIIKIKISKPAVDGKANKAIVEYMAKLVGTNKSNITILNGEKSSQKLLLIKPKRHIINGNDSHFKM